jgi:KDO2-lipid IV(A) lauroyltransferase
MSKERNKAADYAVYLVVRLVVCIIQALSFRAACRLAGGLAWLLYKLDRRHRLVADDNLRHAFPDLTDPVLRDRRVRDVYRHFCLLLMEIVHLPRCLRPKSWRHHLNLRDSPRLVRQLLSGRPLLFVTGHLGNWELGGYVLGLLGIATNAIARKLDNCYLERFLRTFRERTGQKIIYKQGEFDKIEAVLASRGVLATLGDQDAGERGLFVDFFGRPASTHKSIALLALEHNVPMVVIGTLRTQAGATPPEGPGVGTPLHYDVVIEDVLLPEDFAGQANAVPAITQRFTAALERLVRRAPEQYFWLHRRWKHQPRPKGAKKSKQAA